MGEKRNSYRVLVGNPERKRPLRISTRKREDNIKMYLRDIGWGGMDWIHLAQGRNQWRALTNTLLNLPVPENFRIFLSSCATVEIF
jgi:hypothetical protein